MTSSISKVMNRHLAQLKIELDSYQTESDLWLKSGEIPNSAGNLCLHICGNLQYFIGSNLGNTGYIRHRDAEFNLTNVPRNEMQDLIDRTIEVVTSTLMNLDKLKLQKDYPVKVFGEPMTTEYFLVHLTAHLSYHLGQINYHRRILSSNS